MPTVAEYIMRLNLNLTNRVLSFWRLLNIVNETKYTNLYPENIVSFKFNTVSLYLPDGYF